MLLCVLHECACACVCACVHVCMLHVCVHACMCAFMCVHACTCLACGHDLLSACLFSPTSASEGVRPVESVHPACLTEIGQSSHVDTEPACVRRLSERWHWTVDSAPTHVVIFKSYIIQDSQSAFLHSL